MAELRKELVGLIDTKLRVKRAVYEKTQEVFSLLKEVLNQVKEDLVAGCQKEDPIAIEIEENGKYEVRLRVGGDTIVFLMHSNVFDFDSSHSIYRSSYVREDAYRAFCGQIYVYNFLSDSFKYQRTNDLGYLMARLFVNKDAHFFVEGEKQLSFLFNDFPSATVDGDALGDVVDRVIHQCLNFDLYTPPYRKVSIVTVGEINQVSSEMKLQTGKRMGFKFKADQQVKG